MDKLLEAVRNDEYLPSLRERLSAVDGDEAYRILPEIWPSIQTILALSDFARALSAGMDTK